MALDKLQFDRTAAAQGTFSTDMLNRIEVWTAFLADKLRGYGYVVNITPRNAERPQGSRLPGGYTELEYIQSNGTQYIDTGFKPNQDTRVVMDFELIANYSSINGVFGVRDTSAGTAPQMFNLWNSGALAFRSDYFGTQQTLSVSALLIRRTVDKDKNKTTIDGITKTHTIATGQCANSLYLCAVNNAGEVNYYSKIKLYSCQLYDNGTLVRDYVPCKNAVGAAGLYDLVQSKFYANAGTGAFIAGTEIPQAGEPEEPLDPALWYQSDIPTRGEIDRIRRNVDALQTGFARLPDWREILYNNTVDFGQANALEWDLQRIYDWMNAMAAAFLTRRANTIFMQAGGILNA